MHARLAASGGVFFCLLAGCAKQAEKEAEPVPLVQLAPVARQPVKRIITGEGVLRAIDQSAIMPKITAPVAKFYVNRGDHVSKGQLLATLENRDLAASVADAKGAYEQADANYRNLSSAQVPDEMVKAQADVDAARQAALSAKKVLDSREELFKQGALARRLVDEAAAAYAQANSQYATAQKHLESLQSVGRHEEVRGAAGGLESAKGKYEAAQAQLAYSEVRSPISGVIADRAVFPGEMANAGTALLTVMDVSGVIARINIPQAQAAYVRVGQPATVTATDSPVEVAGKVTVVSPAVDPQSTTVEIWVQAPNPGERLRPGGSVHVTIQAGAIPDAVVVPVAALLPSEDGGTAVVVVGQDSVAHQRKAQVGVRNNEVAQLLSGAQAGEQVVVAGGVGLDDGAKVRIQKPREAGEKAGADDEKDEKK
jgi:multidrug efflux pump subunit AcrA (membrane-fusion protein)